MRGTGQCEQLWERQEKLLNFLLLKLPSLATHSQDTGCDISCLWQVLKKLRALLAKPGMIVMMPDGLIQDLQRPRSKIAELSCMRTAWKPAYTVLSFVAHLLLVRIIFTPLTLASFRVLIYTFKM